MTEQDCSHQGFHPFTGKKITPSGSFEVFWLDAYHSQDGGNGHSRYKWAVSDGWYWWPRFKGQEPDNDAKGPFETSRQAYDDARAGWLIALAAATKRTSK